MGGNLVRRYAVIMGVFVSVVATTAAAQQQVAAVASQRPWETRRVTVNMKQIPLADAVAAIARDARLIALFEDAVLPPAARVTMNLKDVPVAEAFRQVLQGTGLMAHIRPEGQVLVVRAEGASRVTGTIVGKVVHANSRQPIGRATVSVRGGTGSVSTGEDGTFRLSAPAGEHVLEVRALGMAPKTITIAVVDGQSATVEIALERRTSVLDEVVVTGTVVETERRALSTPITVITAEDIERRGITRIDQFFRGEVPGVVALEMGTATYTSDSLGAMQKSNMFARGSASLDGSPNPLKTYVDGVEMVDSRFIGLIDPKNIERIEIITGPQAATIYGSGALGGVMQIFTKRGMASVRPQITMSIRYGMLENNMNSGRTPQHDHVARIAGGMGPEFSYSGTLSHRYTGQWQSGLFARNFAVSAGVTHANGPLKLDGSYTRTRSTNGSRLLWNSGPRVAALWIGSLGESPIIKQWVDDGIIAPGRYPLLKNLLAGSQSQQVAFNMDWRLWSFWQHHVTIGEHTQGFDRRPENPLYTRPDDSLFRLSSSRGQRSSMSYNTTIVHRAAWLSSTVTLGANRTTGESRSLSGCKPSGRSVSGWVACNSGANVTVSDGLTDASWGGFGTARLGIADNIFFNVSIRGERNAQYGGSRGMNWSPNYGISATREFGDITVKLLTSYGKATRQPPPGARDAMTRTMLGWTPAEFTGQYANPLLGPEYSRGLQGGLEAYFGGIASITINRYVQYVEDLITSVPVDSIFVEIPDVIRIKQEIFQNFNSASLKAHGWSTTTSLNLWRVRFMSSYSWDDSRVTYYPGQPSQSGRAFLGVPTHYGSLSATYASKGTSVSLVGNYVGASNHYMMNTSTDMVLTTSLNQVRSPMYVPLNALRDQRNFYSSRIPGYMKADISASHRLTSMATGTLNIVNAGNGFGSDVGVMNPALGRQTQLGLSLRW